jgi:uncharacterized membrane protein YfcA
MQAFRRNQKANRMQSKFWSPATDMTPTAFGILAFYGIGFGLLSLPIALFVGPQMLAASVTMIVVGIASRFVARGLQRRSRGAWRAGVLLSAGLAVVAMIAVVQSLQEREFAAIAFWAALACLSVGLCVILIAARREYGLTPHRPNDGTE